jgi:hypothetical protein
MEITIYKKEINKGIIVGILIFSLISILPFDLIVPKIINYNKRNLIFFSIFSSIFLTRWVGNLLFEKIKENSFKPIFLGVTVYSMFFLLLLFLIKFFIYYTKG